MKERYAVVIAYPVDLYEIINRPTIATGYFVKGAVGKIIGYPGFWTKLRAGSNPYDGPELGDIG